MSLCVVYSRAEGIMICRWKFPLSAKILHWVQAVMAGWVFGNYCVFGFPGRQAKQKTYQGSDRPCYTAGRLCSSWQTTRFTNILKDSYCIFFAYLSLWYSSTPKTLKTDEPFVCLPILFLTTDILRFSVDNIIVIQQSFQFFFSLKFANH